MSTPAYGFTILGELLAPQPSKSQRRQLEILEATIDGLAQDGLDSTTHESIAKRCQASRSIVQHYFPDREKLILTAIEYVRARFQRYCVERIAREKTPVRMLEAYIDATFEWTRERGTHARAWLLFYYYCGINADFRALNTDLVVQGERRIAELIRLGVQAGKFKSAKDEALLLRAKQLQIHLTGTLLAVMTEDLSKRALPLQKQCSKTCLELAAGRMG